MIGVTHNQLVDTIGREEARVLRTMVMVDIVGSTEAKFREPEPTWVLSTAAVYGAVIDTMLAELDSSGEIVKFTGDGVLMAFEQDDAAAAINAAIRVQETIAESVEKRQSVLQCGIGIASGKVVMFETPNGQKDYLGSTVDLCARLSGATSAQGIFVDADTISIAQMSKVTSKIGCALRRTVGEYKSKPQNTSGLKGFRSSIEYHELFWANQLYGVKSEAVTETGASTAASETPRSSAAAALAARPMARGRMRGSVIKWDPERQQGFIRADGGESYYTNRHYIIGNPELAEDETVFFSPIGRREGGRCDVASATITLGSWVTGKITAIHEKGFGFVRVTDDNGNTHDVFAPPADCGGDLRVGQCVEFRVGDSPRGAEARELRPSRAEAA